MAKLKETAVWRESEGYNDTAMTHDSMVCDKNTLCHCQIQYMSCDYHVTHSPAGEGMYCMYAGRTIGLGLGGKYWTIFISWPVCVCVWRGREGGREGRRVQGHRVQMYVRERKREGSSVSLLTVNPFHQCSLSSGQHTGAPLMQDPLPPHSLL